MRIKSFTFNLFAVNTYLLWDEPSREAAIVDAGMVSDSDNRLVADFVKDNRLRLKHLLNTHFHIDHTFGIDFVKKEYGLQVTGHPQEQIWAEHLAEQARMFGLFTEGVAPLRIERFIDEGDLMEIGRERLEILHIPGHSPGSLLFYAPLSGFLLSGDVLFRRSVGRTDLAMGDYRQLIDGITGKLAPLPGETVVWPGHGPRTTIAEELRENPYIQ